MNNKDNILKAMSTDERILLAYDSETSPELLVELSKDEEWLVCLALTENANTPADALTALSQHEMNIVRSSVADHANTPAATLTALSSDDDEVVRWSVATNANTPLNTVETLAKAIKNPIDAQKVQGIISKRKNAAA